MKVDNAKLLVLDVETTGLDPSKCQLLELACVSLTSEGLPAAAFHTLIKPAELTAANAEPQAIELAIKSGLAADIERFGRSLDVAAQGFYTFLTNEGYDLVDVNTIMLVGRNPTFDLAFLRSCLPGLRKQLHYRTIDTGSLVRVLGLAATSSEADASTFLQSVAEPQGAVLPKHRAQADVELAWREFYGSLQVLRKIGGARC